MEYRQQIKNVYQRMCRKLTKSDINKVRFLLTDVLDEKVDNPIHEAHSALDLFIAAFGQEHLTLQLLRKAMSLLGRKDLVKELEKEQPFSQSPTSLISGEDPEFVSGRRLYLYDMLEQKRLDKGCMMEIVFFHNLNVDLAEKEWPAVVEQLLYKYPLEVTTNEASVSDWVHKHFDSVLNMSQLQHTSYPEPTTAPETEEVTATPPENACACTSDETNYACTIPKNSKAEHSNESRRLGISPDDITEGSSARQRRP